MHSLISPQQLVGAQSPEDLLYALMNAYLDFIEQHGETALQHFNNQQHTLLAYCYLDSQMQQGGFVQLIAAGYGDYIFSNPVADSLRRWRIKPTSKIIEQAAAVYAKCGAKIEALAEEGNSVATIREIVNNFEELDADYYDAAEADMAAAAEYVRAHLNQFTELADA